MVYKTQIGAIYHHSKKSSKKILAHEKPKVQKPVFKVPEIPTTLDARIDQIREDWNVQKQENWKKKGDNFF